MMTVWNVFMPCVRGMCVECVYGVRVWHACVEWLCGMRVCCWLEWLRCMRVCCWLEWLRCMRVCCWLDGQDLDGRLRELEERKMETQKVIATGQIYDFMRNRLMVCMCVSTCVCLLWDATRLCLTPPPPPSAFLNIVRSFSWPCAPLAAVRILQPRCALDLLL
jgi:hypothetical protein